MSDNDPQLPTNEHPEAPTAGTPPVSSLRRYRGLLIGGATVIALGIGAGGVGLGAGLAGMQSSGSNSSSGSSGSGGQQAAPGTSPQHKGTFDGPGTASVNATAATAAQKVGVVTIVSTLDYDPDTQAAGTGIILTSKGEILTNNHVVEGSTAITVTVESTGASYTAKVVGTDETDDIAVLQLVDSSGADVTGLTRQRSTPARSRPGMP